MSPEHVQRQVRQVAAVARRRDLHTVILRDPLSLSWLAGARWHVQHSLDKTAFDAVVTDIDAESPSLGIVANIIEASRLVDTELAGLGISEVIEVPWTKDRSDYLPRGAGVGADRGLPGVADLSRELARLRRRLTPEQQHSLAALTLDASTRLGQVARTVEPGCTERDIAAQIAATLTEGGMDVLVCLVGTDDRLRDHKHPLPTERRMRERMMLSICARRAGLCTSVTRFVTVRGFDRADYQKILSVESAMLDATRLGASLAAPLRAGIDAYRAVGLDPLEWTRHHQGGIAGLAPRETLAVPDADLVLEDGVVVAWNPSAAGWKAEGVAVVGPDGAHLLPEDPDWPTITVAGRSRPAPLALSSDRSAATHSS